MNIQQHAILVRYTAKNTTGLDDLNVRLQRGWRVVKVTPLGGTLNDETGCLAALIVIEREATDDAGLAVHREEQSKEIVEELSEGNGSGQEVPAEIEGDDNGKDNPLTP